MAKKTRKDNVFTAVSLNRPESNRFDLSHDLKLSMQMGKLVPTACIEVLPGDKFDLQSVNMMRFAPLLAPVMHRVKVRTDWFFVPHRILWSGWEDFITGTGTDVPMPFVHLTGDMPSGSLGDYLGIPAGNYDGFSEQDITALQVAAYYKIYDDWYRDQNLIGEKFTPLESGDNTTFWLDKLSSSPLKAAWEHDYFTSALPTAQQDTEVEIPLTFQDNIPVDFTPGATAADGTWIAVNPVTGAPLGNGDIVQSAGPAPLTSGVHVDSNPAAFDPNGTLTVDVQSDAATINDLRRAFSLQAFLERSIRGGKRYIEQIMSHFGVRSSDARLQRPEFIGRAIQNMTIGEVLATAQSSNDGADAQIAVGHLAGHGISVGGSDRFTYYAEEHGTLMCIVSVLPETAYQDGLHRQFFRMDRLDFAWPEFAGLGEQEIKYKEIRCHDVDSGDDLEGTFGYIPRYGEYRYLPSRVAGQMRTSLDFWHMGRKFDTMPGLNSDFIECDATKRIFAVTDDNVDELFAHLMFDIRCVRKLPRYGVPATI